MFSKAARLWMAIKCEDQKDLDVSLLTAISIRHTEGLARLMDVSYQGTIDHEGETLNQCVDEMRGTMEGKYGPFISEASYLVFKDSKIVSACLVTLWKNHPLIAFSMTDPEYQGKGFAKQLILKAMDMLSKNSYEVLYLVVTNGNIAAQNLYRKIGFKELGEALPGQPPPNFES